MIVFPPLFVGLSGLLQQQSQLYQQQPPSHQSSQQNHSLLHSAGMLMFGGGSGGGGAGGMSASGFLMQQQLQQAGASFLGAAGEGGVVGSVPNAGTGQQLYPATQPSIADMMRQVAVMQTQMIVRVGWVD
jgi:hypothetical protein